jgi:hypothetical protein
MNERIKELAVQTHLFTDYEGTPQYKVWGFTDAGLEKFAELIVRECIAQCNDGDSRWFIAQHFGVEE